MIIFRMKTASYIMMYSINRTIWKATCYLCPYSCHCSIFYNQVQKFILGQVIFNSIIAQFKGKNLLLLSCERTSNKFLIFLNPFSYCGILTKCYFLNFFLLNLFFSSVLKNCKVNRLTYQLLH